MDSLGITCDPGPGASSDGQLEVLAAIYRRAIERYEEKEGGPAQSRPEDAKERSENASSATEKYTG